MMCLHKMILDNALLIVKKATWCVCVCVWFNGILNEFIHSFTFMKIFTDCNFSCLFKFLVKKTCQN